MWHYHLGNVRKAGTERNMEHIRTPLYQWAHKERSVINARRAGRAPLLVLGSRLPEHQCEINVEHWPERVWQGLFSRIILLDLTHYPLIPISFWQGQQWAFYLP